MNLASMLLFGHQALEVSNSPTSPGDVKSGSLKDREKAVDGEFCNGNLQYQMAYANLQNSRNF